MLLFCPSRSCIIICCINRFTSLCKNFLNSLEFLVETFRCHVHHFQCLTVPVELTASVKSSGKLNKFLHSEVNLLIQHIIVQDQDGQNNNRVYLLQQTCQNHHITCVLNNVCPLIIVNKLTAEMDLRCIISKL